MLKFVYGISCWIFTEAIMYLVRLKEALLRLTEFLGVPWNQIFEEKSSPTYPFRTLGQSCFLLQRSLARFTFSVAINERDQQRQKDFRKRVSKNKRSIFATKKSANARGCATACTARSICWVAINPYFKWQLLCLPCRVRVPLSSKDEVLEIHWV